MPIMVGPGAIATVIGLTSTIKSSEHALLSFCSVGGFLRVGNDAIQPLEKSASNPLICKDSIFDASGLRVFLALGEGGEEGPGESGIGP